MVLTNAVRVKTNVPTIEYFPVPANPGLVAMRQSLMTEMYGEGYLPDASTVDITPNWTGDVANARVTYPDECASVTRIRARTPRNGVIISHLNYPTATALNRLVAVFGGHETNGYLDLGGTLVQELLAEGYHVLGVDMPIYGNNTTQDYRRLDGSSVTVTFAHDYTPLQNDGAHPLRFFIDGHLGGIDWALDELGLTHYDIVGISGGGWTIDYLSAIDFRCRRSYPVFGSLPFHLRVAAGGPGADGDYEQLPARTWWQAGCLKGSYVCLYALGCLDAGRKRTQVLGTLDTAFPVGTVLAQVSAYGAMIDALVPSGNHEIRIDTTSAGHVYSPETVAFILGDLNANP